MSEYYSYRRKPVWDDPSYYRFEPPPMTDEQRQIFLDLAQRIRDDVARQRRQEAEEAERAASRTPRARVARLVRRLLRRG